LRVKEVWKTGLAIAIFITIFISLLYGYLSFLGYLALAALNSTEMLQSLIQAQATILGFLGVIVAYMLTSYDSRIDRCEQQVFDFAFPRLGKETPEDLAIVQQLAGRTTKMKDLKKDALVTISITSIFMILSLLLCITTLGIKNQILGSLGFYLFFGGISNMIFLFYEMTKDTNS
jgi:hypothetical protein